MKQDNNLERASEKTLRFSISAPNPQQNDKHT